MKSGRILALICSACLAPLSAENYTHVSGVILDASSASVPGALVSVVNEDTGVRRTTLSQPDGGYVVSPLLAGVYKITVRKIGFRTMIRFGVRLLESQPERVDFNLVIGSVQETVTVEGTAPLLNTREVSVGTLVERDEIEKLPVSGGGLLTLLQLAPGTVVTPATRGEAGQFTVNGQRPNTHYFTVDGVSANSGVGGGGLPAQSTGGTLPGMTAFGSLDSLVSLDALEEMRVQTSTTMSEFGRMPGAQVSLTTRSGSNELHGSLLYGLRNEALGANDWFANRHADARAPQREQEFAATLGGPVWRDHTFFFLSYEGMRLRQPFVLNQPVPTLAARSFGGGAGPLLSLFPEPNGPDLGNNLALWTAGISRPSQLDTGAVRVDHAFSSRLTSFARYDESPSSTEFGSDPVNALDLGSRSLTLGLNLRARPNMVLDLRANVSSATSHSVWRQAGPAILPACALGPSIAFFLGPAGVCDYLVRLSIAGVGQVFSGSEGRRSQTQFQISPTASWNPGTHSIRFGTDYRRLGPSRSDDTGSLSILADTVRDLASRGNYWTANSPPQHISAVLREISLFAQDAWRVTPRLTLTYGLRWEISPAPNLNAPVSLLDAAGVLAPIQSPIWQSTYANFAPRFGVAYQPFSNGRTLIRGGMGFYYDSSLSLATDLVNNGPLNVTQYASQRTLFVTTQLGFGFMPDLRLPLVKQWNVSVEHAITSHDLVSVGYAGSSSDNLIRREIGGPGSTSSLLLALATNHGSSRYHGLEAQYRRRLARGFRAQVSYAWSHSLDNSSADSGLYLVNSQLTPAQDHASSDFDVRHSLSAGFTYEIPHSRGWALDGVFRARTGFPINVLDSEQSQAISYENVYRPDLIGGLPVWISDPSAPDGRRINRDAFQPVNSVLGFPQQGNLGRNALSGRGMSQLDLAVRREFSLGEQRSLLLRVEAFNAFNHPNFADPIRFLSSPLFGQSTSMLNLMLGSGSPSSGLAPIFQAGGARSLQFVFRFKF
ncbi:MAG: TonB-dependent receptor [Acidobacteriota bacterium]|nr:TonB-dependent receptor [Acidobacteriota bacterium]